MKEISDVLSSPQPEDEADMRAPDQRKLIIALRRVDLISTPSWRQEDALVRQPDVKLGAELHCLRRAALKPAPPVRTMARQALPKHFDQKVDIRETDQAWKFALQRRPQGPHNAQPAV